MYFCLWRFSKQCRHWWNSSWSSLFAKVPVYWNPRMKRVNLIHVEYLKLVPVELFNKKHLVIFCSIFTCKHLVSLHASIWLVYMQASVWFTYSKTCLKRPLKNRQNKDLNDRWSKLLQSILQYFWPALSNKRSWKPFFGLLFEWTLMTGLTVQAYG